MLNQSRAGPNSAGSPCAPKSTVCHLWNRGAPTGDIGHKPTHPRAACRIEGEGLGEIPEGTPGPC